MSGMRTAFSWREYKLSVTGSCQALDGDVYSRCSFDHDVEGIRKELVASARLASILVGKSVSGRDASVRESGVFRYVDRVGRAKLDIGCRSIHIPMAARKKACARTRRLAFKNRIDDIDQRHVASICASWVRTIYAHRTCLRTGRSQALGGQRCPAMEQHRRYS